MRIPAQLQRWIEVFFTFAFFACLAFLWWLSD